MPSSPHDWITETISDSRPVWGDLMKWARHEWGTGAARKVAESAGVSPRTGRRWLASSTAPKSPGALRTKTSIIGQGAQRHAAANKARKARKVIVGEVRLWEISRDIPGKAHLPPDISIRGVMGTVADLIEAGKDEEAATLMSSAVITSYGGDYVGADCGLEDGLASALRVTEWTDGFDLR
jgi:hypothetical protein